MKVQKFIPVILGVLLIVFGCSVLFDSLNIAPNMWFMSVIGLGLIVIGIKVKLKVVRDIGLLSLILGIAVILNELFIYPAYSKMFYLAAVAVAILLIALLRKNSWLFLLGIFVAAIAGIMFLKQMPMPEELRSAYSLIVLATALVLLFVVKNDKLRYSPLVLGILCYLISLPRFLMYAGYINEKIAQVISAAILIVSGLLLVIFVYKKAVKENESE